MKQWAIYYDDGSRFTDEDGTPYDAPRTGVQIIAQKDTSMGWELVSESDLFYYEESRRGFYGCNPTGSTLFDHLWRAKYPLVFAGRMVTEEEFRAIVLRVLMRF
jgi:hypothetical protein